MPFTHDLLARIRQIPGADALQTPQDAQEGEGRLAGIPDARRQPGSMISKPPG